jgi:hypothetical protein
VSDKLAGTVHSVSEDLEKERSLAADRARDLARGIAALQQLHTGEEQARQQSGFHLQQGIDKLRDEIANESKERRVHMVKLNDESGALSRGLQQRDERLEALHKHVVSESTDLRDHLARETRQREATIAQVEQKALSYRSAKEVPGGAVLSQEGRSPGSATAGDGQVHGAVVVELRELKNQTADDLMRHRRQLEGHAMEQNGLAKTVNGVAERCEVIRSGLSAVQAAMVDVVVKQKELTEVAAKLDSTREELKRESQDRKTEDGILARSINDTESRLERSEQVRIAADNGFRQDILQVKTMVTKEVRDQAAATEGLKLEIRKEGEAREESITREARLRNDAQEHIKETFNAAIREERSVRGKDVLRLEGRKGVVSGKPGAEGPGIEGVAVQTDLRALRQALGDTQDRLVAAESRQKSAEERTVSMLDAIMSGLTNPGE